VPHCSATVAQTDGGLIRFVWPTPKAALSVVLSLWRLPTLRQQAKRAAAHGIGHSGNAECVGGRKARLPCTAEIGCLFVCLCVCWFSRARQSLEEEIAINETSQCRAVEICVEDHPKMVLSVLTCGMPRELRPTVGR
jgi:hypothetical protein